MDFLIELGNLVLVWTLVIIAIVFATGTFLTAKATRQAARSKITRPLLTSGSAVVFRDTDGSDKTYVVTSVRMGLGKRREVILQDQVSWADEQRHSDLP